MSLHEYHNVTLVANDDDAYAPCLGAHKKLLLKAILLKLSQINFNIMIIFIQKI